MQILPGAPWFPWAFGTPRWDRGILQLVSDWVEEGEGVGVVSSKVGQVSSRDLPAQESRSCSGVTSGSCPIWHRPVSDLKTTPGGSMQGARRKLSQCHFEFFAGVIASKGVWVGTSVRCTALTLWKVRGKGQRPKVRARPTRLNIRVLPTHF